MPRFVASIGNQLAKGNRGGGRKGYEYEEKQLKKMRKILNRDLALIEKFQKKNLSPEEMEKFQKLERRVLHIMDKLHANKQETKLEITKPILIKRIRENETGV